MNIDQYEFKTVEMGKNAKMLQNHYNEIVRLFFFC